MIEFEPFQKIARLNRDMVVTEKLDGTNASIYIGADGAMQFGSRTRWITPKDDNFGFARWGMDHRDELAALGAGMHRGEWWGSGIQRGYGLTERRFSLFNATRWAADDQLLESVESQDPLALPTWQERPPKCCGVVPELYRGLFRTDAIDGCIHLLRKHGSYAAPGFAKPEGIIVWHEAARQLFKVTLEKDELPKALSDRSAE